MADGYVYKIRRRKDGLFSSGGMEVRFGKTGKTWTSQANLNGHITLMQKWRKDLLRRTKSYVGTYLSPMIESHQKKIQEIEEYFAGCEVVPYLINEGPAYGMPMLESEEEECSRECATH